MKVVKGLLVGFSVCITLLLLLLFNVFQLPAPPKSVSSDFVLRNVSIINTLVSKTKITSLRVSNGIMSLSSTSKNTPFYVVSEMMTKSTKLTFLNQLEIAYYVVKA